MIEARFMKLESKIKKMNKKIRRHEEKTKILEEKVQTVPETYVTCSTFRTQITDFAKKFDLEKVRTTLTDKI